MSVPSSPAKATFPMLLPTGMDSTFAVPDLVVIVIVDVAGAPFGETDDGLKLHEAVVGSPEHAKFVAVLNPFIGVTDTVTVAELPAAIVPLEGETDTVKSGAGGAVMVTVTATEVDALLFGSPP